MKLHINIFLLILLLGIEKSYSQNPSNIFRPPASPLSLIKLLPDTISFKGFDSTFWIKNDYFDLTNQVRTDTAFIFGKVVKNDCILVFTLTIKDHSKIIRMDTYANNFFFEKDTITSLVVASENINDKIVTNQSFYLHNRWGGISFHCKCIDGSSQCFGNSTSFQVVNFILEMGKLNFVI